MTTSDNINLDRCQLLPVTATKADRVAAHRAKMAWKAGQRKPVRPIGMVGSPAVINRRTGKPHEHRAEIARRVRQGN